MNTTASSTHALAYTPLECLLLFQSLLSYGTRDEDFIRISEALTNNSLVRDGPTYEPLRLGVDALRQLYAQLLYEEVKAEGLDQEVQEDGTQTGSKKRKLPSPTLPLLKDLSQYKDKLPLMVDRLYARYRDRMIQSIREDEKRYALVQKEIQEIERGEWDERILEEDREIARRNGVISSGPAQLKTNGTAPTVPPVQTSTFQRPPPEPQSVQVQPPHSVPPVTSSPVLVQAKASPKPDSPATQHQPQASQAPVKQEVVPTNDAQKAPQPQPPNYQASRPSPQIPEARPPNGVSPRPPPKRTPSNGQHVQQVPHGPPLQPQPQFQWHQEHPYPPHPQQQLQHPQFQSGSPQQHYNQQRPLQQQQQQYGPPPPRGNFPQPHGYPPPHQHVPSSPSPLNSQHPSPLNAQHSPQLGSQHQTQHGQHQQAVLLPPTNGIGRQTGPGSPGLPLDALADMAGQQYRAASGSPMTPQPPQMQPPQGYQMQPPPMSHPGHPTHPGPPVQYPQQRPLSNGPPSGQPHGPPQQWSGPYPQYNGPPQFPPQFHQSPNPGPTFPTPQTIVNPPDNRPYNSPYNANQGPKPPVPGGTTVVSQPLPKHRPSLPSTPASQMAQRFFTGTDTEWTPTPSASTPRPNQIVHPPTVEPISPVMRHANPSAAVKSTPPKKGPRKSEPIKPQTSNPKPPILTKRIRGGQRARAGSTASSVVAGSHRSQSVASLLEDESASRHVKQEVATPIGVEDGGDTTADELSALPAQKPKSKPESTLLKRKRASTPDSLPSSYPPTQVLWTRNFPKISSSTLEGITAHKNASMFAAPIKERDAPGYKNVILRPQDLKHIRSSINAGNRAALAAAPADMPPSATSVWLPISEDLIPPKAIINNAQLETELMRMFANAIMFNADPDRGLGRRLSGKGQNDDDEEKGGEILGYEIDEDGVVKDTRAMFYDVEKLITELRSAERRSEELREESLSAIAVPTPMEESADGEEGGGDDASSVQGSVAKRRRKA